MTGLIPTINERALLDRAKRALFSLSIGDTSARLSELNSLYGLGKMMYALEGLGIDSSSLICLFTPDASITRNNKRWEAGFGYGCYLRWPGVSEGLPVIFPEMRANACGVLVAKVDEKVDPEEVYMRLSDARDELGLDGIPLTLNLGASNHFVEVCTVTRSVDSSIEAGSQVVVIHTSPVEFKQLLYPHDELFERGARWEQTPLGQILTMTGQAAEEYYQDYCRVERFSRERRVVIAKAIFGSVDVITNPTHQGLFSVDSMGLGLYRVDDDSANYNGTQLFPVTLRWDIPIFLVKGLPNLCEDVIQTKGHDLQCGADEPRALLKEANVLPHGGGYELPFKCSSVTAQMDSERRIFHLNGFEDDEDKQFVFSYPSELPYGYRGRQVMDAIKKLRLGEPVAELQQRFTIKY